MSEEIQVGFWDHIATLRVHLLWAFFIFVVATSAVFIYGSDWVVSKLLEPLLGIPLVFLSPLGPFLFKLQISFYAGLIISLPLFLILALNFVSSALTRTQKISTFFFIACSLVLGAAAVSIAYLYVIPYTLKFLLSLTVPGTSLLLTTESYLQFFILEIMVCFALLQLPLLIVLASYLHLINPNWLAKQRRMLYLVLLIALAILTPTTDILTLIIAYLPGIVLLESGILIGRMLYRRGLV